MTLQNEIDNTPTGGTLEIAPGSHEVEPPLRITRAMTIRGDGRIVFLGTPTEQAPNGIEIIGGGTPGVDPVSDVTIEGLALEGATAGALANTSPMVRVWNARDITLRHLRLLGGHAAITGSHVSGWRIDEVVARNMTEWGIVPTDSEWVAITNVAMLNDAVVLDGSGVEFKRCSRSSLRGARIQNYGDDGVNVRADNDAGAEYALLHSQSIIVAGVTISGCRWGIKIHNDNADSSLKGVGVSDINAAGAKGAVNIAGHSDSPVLGVSVRGVGFDGERVDYTWGLSAKRVHNLAIAALEARNTGRAAVRLEDCSGVDATALTLLDPCACSKREGAVHVLDSRLVRCRGIADMAGSAPEASAVKLVNSTDCDVQVVAA